MATYASSTEVSPASSRAEIERTLVRYNASKFMYGWDERGAAVAFEMQSRRLRFILPLPPKDDFQWSNHRPPRRRTPEQINDAWEQACRQRWRALALAIKAKLESVEAGIESFDEAFMGQIILPSGGTVAEWMVPQIEQAYTTGQMPPLLGAG